MTELPERVDVLVVGSGFAGSLLARGLVEMGLEVLVVDRGRHPRFALGESTTPLGNLALERLALRFGWRDVWDLATWGRWQARHPGLRVGLKRGFSFYSAAANEAGPPVLVAASPNDDIADTQWLRADVDAELCRRAREAGAVVLEEWQVVDLDLSGPVRASLRPVGADGTACHVVRADFLVDGSGAGRLLEGHVGRRRTSTFDTSLVYAHLTGLPSIDEPMGAPYPPSFSAVHHLLDLGWMYELRFDDDLVSCGVIVDRERCREFAVEPSAAAGPSFLEAVGPYLRRAPRLLDRLRAAEPATPVGYLEQVGRRVTPVAGANWARLPHAVGFIDPMFSTGIAWSLLGVERLLDVLAPELDVAVRARRLQDYARLVDREFDHLVELLEGARATWSDLEALGWYSMVYFAAASFAETRQRLEATRVPERPWAWDGFLGSEDPEVQEAVHQARRVAVDCAGAERLERLRQGVPEWIESRNIAGLASPDRHPWYAVDLEPLLLHADRLGLTTEQVEGRLPRLLGQVGFTELRSEAAVR